MPKPKGRGAEGGRPARAKAPKKGPKAKGAKPAARRGRTVAPKEGVKAPVAKAAVPPVPVAVPKPGVEKTKEGTMAEAKVTPEQYLASILTPERSRDTGHVCWDCKHFKPVQKGSKFPPADTIGWCTQIHWPFYWCITDFNVVKKCYTFEKGVYAPFQPARFP
ncbi:MAG: hypothetical protein L0Y78_10295 [candidate division NC10 bacterium]|nr:hypothetical protein [candidate division NC10 bacterium]